MQNAKWIRKGDLKAVLVTKPYGTNEWKLYNLSIDPGETSDLFKSEPETLQQIISEWKKYATEVSVVAILCMKNNYTKIISTKYLKYSILCYLRIMLM